MIKIADRAGVVHDQNEALDVPHTKLVIEVREGRDGAGDGRLPLADRRAGVAGGRRDRADGDPRRAE